MVSHILGCFMQIVIILALFIVCSLCFIFFEILSDFVLPSKLCDEGGWGMCIIMDQIKCQQGGFV